MTTIGKSDLPNLPPHLVITNKVWDDSPAVHDDFEILASFRGLAYANRGRVVDVMVVQKKSNR